jgi:hypothetical protein
MVYKRKQLILTASKILFFGALLSVGLLITSQGKVSASTARCANNDGSSNHNEYAGLVVETGYINDSGTLVAASGSNMDVLVETNSDTLTPAGNVVDATPYQISLNNDTVTKRVMSRRFRSMVDNNTGAYCPQNPGNTAVILRGDGTQGSYDDSGSYNRWMLDCDWSKHNSYYQKFTLTAEGTPAGARPGGTWKATIVVYSADQGKSSMTVDPANGASQRVRFVYTQPPDTLPSLTLSPNNFTCSSAGWLYGVAYDSNDSNYYLSVTITANGLSKTQTANQQEVTSTGAPWSGHTHAFYFYPAQSPFNQTYTQTVTYTFKTTGVDSAGNSYGTVTGTATINGANCNNPPSGSVTLDCNNGDGEVSVSYSDPDAATSAYLMVYYSGTSTRYNVSSGQTVDLSSIMDLNDVSASLFVDDTGVQGTGWPSSPTATGSHAHCDRPPSGNVAASCVISGNATDPDNTGKPLTIKMYYEGLSGSGAPSTTTTTDPSNGGYFQLNPTTDGVFKNYFPSFKPHQVYVYVLGIESQGNQNGVNPQLSGSPVTVTCYPTVSCSSVTPSINEADSPAKITAIFNYTSADAPAHPPYSINISVSPSGGSGSGLDSASTNTASYTYTTPNLPAGTYTASATFSGPSGFTTVSCPPAPFIAYNLPYYKVYGNDVKAGGAFDAGSCSNSTGNTIGSIGFLGGFLPSPDGYGIKGFDNTANTGSGAQFAAYAIGHIASFNSAMMRGAVGGNPGPSKGLTFANSGGNYGGDVGGTNCIHNWANDQANAIVTGSLSGTVNPASLNGTYTASGDLTLSTASSTDLVPKGSRTIIYVNGANVRITAGNTSGIKYDTSTWGSIADIPSLWVVVNGGNIYIDPGVTQLDGVYVAQPDSGNGKGKIFTCSNNGFGPADLTGVNGTAGDACNNQLTVNGAFIAQEVELLRSFSSLRYSQAGENPYGSGSNCVGKPTCAAEVFNFGPEVFMAPPNGLGNSGGSKYDYITELPPVL